MKLLNSLVVHKTVAIQPPADASLYKGRYFSNKPPGFPVVIAPVYWGYYALTGDARLDPTFLLAKCLAALFSAATIGMIYLLLSSYGLSLRAVLFGVLAAAVGTIYPAYSALANSMPLSVLLCIGTLLAARRGQLDPDQPTHRVLVLFLGSLSCSVDYANAFFVLPIVLWVGIDVLRRREIAPICVALVPVGVVMGYNYAAFDNPFTISYAHYQPPSYVPWSGASGSFGLSRIPRGLYGLLVSPGRGLFVLSPVALFGAWAAVSMLRRRELDRVWIAAPIVTAIGIMSTYALWHGGHSVGYRHILVAGVVLAALSAFVYESMAIHLRVVALVVLLASSVSGLGSFWVQLDPVLLRLTWKEEPADAHASYYPELLLPMLAGSVPSAATRPLARERPDANASRAPATPTRAR